MAVPAGLRREGTPARAQLFGLTPDRQADLAARIFARFRSHPAVTIETAEDALGAAVVRAETLNPCVSDLAQWLLHVAGNIVRDQMKTRGSALDRRHLRPDHMEPHEVDALFAPLAIGGVTAEDRMSRAETASALREHLAKLPRQQRRALWLYEVKGLPWATVADRIGVRNAQVARNTGAAARQRLRASLTGDPRFVLGGVAAHG